MIRWVVRIAGDDTADGLLGLYEAHAIAVMRVEAWNAHHESVAVVEPYLPEVTG